MPLETSIMIWFPLLNVGQSLWCMAYLIFPMNKLIHYILNRIQGKKKGASVRITFSIWKTSWTCALGFLASSKTGLFFVLSLWLRPIKTSFRITLSVTYLTNEIFSWLLSYLWHVFNVNKLVQDVFLHTIKESASSRLTFHM